MWQIVKKLLLQIVDDIDAGNTNADEAELAYIVDLLKECVRKDNPISKYQAYTYLGLSRAQFDNLVREGKIPPGKKVPGFKELMWTQKDIIAVKKARKKK